MRHTIRTVTLVFLSLFGAVGMADTGEELRQSYTSQGQGIERGSVGDGIVSFDEYAPLKLRSAGQSSAPNKDLDTRSRTAEIGVSADPNFWFYDADVILFIYRDEVYNIDENNPQRGTAEIILAKQRNGPTGVVPLAFLKHYTRFENLAIE